MAAPSGSPRGGNASLGCPSLMDGKPLVFMDEACVWSADSWKYKLLQEGSYTNHEGAGMVSVVALMATYPIIVALQQLIVMACKKKLALAPLRHAIEFCGSCLPLIGTFCAPHMVWRSAALFVCFGTCLATLVEDPLVWPRLLSQALASRAARKAEDKPVSFSSLDERGNRLRFVAEYRAVVMMTTCIVILAVDFPSIFPRAHAKTEEFGYSLMDLGTGSIIVSSAICSKAARGERQGRGLGKVMARALALWPVLLIGFVRFALVRGTDYHVPTSEYGVHWNFFFTIAVVNLVSTAADLGPAASAAAGVVILLAYQFYLSALGGSDFILHAPRVGLFSANREGVLSCAGFLGIHWLAVALGALIRHRAYQAASRKLALLAAAAGGLAVTWCLEALGVAVSRRMCNLPYCVLTLAVNALVLGGLAAVDLLWPGSRPKMPSVYTGVQDSMLVTFLAANLCTGVVNLQIQPLLVPCYAAMVIMICYLTVWALPICLLSSWGIAPKLW
ncbi:unnamed protein product [Prorocentrum cordatum]|uniref:GPI-anchored wall transfer protein n=1 Tax=Prorocentrum cordatum TaxID=2364126 RepID=A0ABN9U386_9DINO|nr:unnamed protein product [Polarella glacialis]